MPNTVAMVDRRHGHGIVAGRAFRIQEWGTSHGP